MPIVNGNYQQLTADTIRDALELELQNEFGEDIDLTESSVFSTLAETLATVLANNQEGSLQEVYKSAFLDTATGIDLDRVVQIIGIQRRPAIHTTGVERFFATGPVTQDYVIRRGTTVQTDSDTPTEFETIEQVTLELIDSFESGSLSNYSGDASSGSIITDSTAPQGDNVLQLDATDGAHIYNDDILLQQGTRFHAHVRPNSGTVPTITFAIQPGDATDHYQIAVDEANDSARLEVVENGTATTLDSVGTLGLTTGSFHELDWRWDITDNIAVTINDPDGNELGVLSATDATWTEGHPGFKSNDATGTKEFDWYTTSEVSANIRTVLGGTVGNVGPNSISILPSPPSGVDTITNLYPTGTTDYTDTNQQQFVIGEDREEDETLRDRANDAIMGGGDATHDALVSHLINETPGVSSVTVYENKKDTDNTGTGGLPPHSFEAVVFGGDDEDVARGIFEKKAITSRDYGGANGTAHSYSVTSNVSGDSRTIQWSRPSEVSVDMTLDLAIDGSYVGDDEIRDTIARYVGGTLSNGSEVVGLGVGEDPRIDALRDIIVGDNTGVVGFDQSVDGSPIETTPSITTVNGLDVIDIGANEVAQTDATDTSIIINTREL